MGNADTVHSITDNVEEVLRNQGAKFSPATYEEEAIPAALLPMGKIFYEREDFEYTHGQKPEYAEIDFLLQIILRNENPKDLIRTQQTWVHNVRDSLTVDALNIDDLSSSKLVSRVTTDSIEIDNRPEGLSIINYIVNVRYREV